ncbi:hypothetical protein [Arthrobacter sp. YN]|uniref:hypothetical protein n=1 Tax=Arthrobacter sp. YN TaxID=2020486 RepID=UPI000B5F8285|nr:hypothetical protein [Arthrobacter sp. YN]ASN19858.1 hypothetical protein CGK93_09370 [Arthrobacter sp. YN]
MTSPSEQRLYLALLLSENELDQWDNVDMLAAEAITEGIDTPAVLALASQSSPIDAFMLKDLLNDLAEEREWPSREVSESILLIAMFRARDVLDKGMDPIAACDFIYQQCYLKLENQGDMTGMSKLQSFVEVSISWDENIVSTKRSDSLALSEELRGEALAAFRALLA